MKNLYTFLNNILYLDCFHKTMKRLLSVSFSTKFVVEETITEFSDICKAKIYFFVIVFKVILSLRGQFKK